MTDEIVKQVVREIDPLSADDLVGAAVEKVVDSRLPALPAVEADGKFAGVFGEREFMAALFPGYVGELSSARVVTRALDDTIERRLECAQEPVRGYLTTDQVMVEDDYSDTELAELFLHHRVLVIPVATDGRVHAVVTRHDFFLALFERFVAKANGSSG